MDLRPKVPSPIGRKTCCFKQKKFFMHQKENIARDQNVFKLFEMKT